MNWKQPITLIRDKIKVYQTKKSKPATEAQKIDEEKSTAKLTEALNRFTQVLTINGDVDTLVSNIQGHLTFAAGNTRVWGMTTVLAVPVTSRSESRRQHMPL